MLLNTRNIGKHSACISATFLVIRKSVRGATDGVVKGAAGGGTAKDRGEFLST